MKHSLRYFKTNFFKTLLIKIPLILILLFSFTPLAAEIIQIKAARYSVDLPEGWKKLDVSNPARAAFMSADGSAALKILVYDRDKYTEAAALYKDVQKDLAATGSKAEFYYEEMDAVLADLYFSTGSLDVRGYAVILNGENFDYALLAYCPLDSYETMQVYLLSALDSFSPDQPGRLHPGLVSCFLEQAAPDEMAASRISIDKIDYTFEISNNKLETSRDIINREARILAGFKSVNINAWYRFYRMIYRDNYLALEQVYKFINHRFADQDKKAVIRKTLQWIQGFAYTRAGGTADFTSPLEAAAAASGDCDSRVILYVTLLHYMGVDAVLLVSSTYSHSAAGISLDDYPAAGAVIQSNNRKYLYAELTAQVEIGKIQAQMADAALWTVFPLNK